MPVVAGIDSSTQSCTVELRDLDTSVLLGCASSPHLPVRPPISEQDPAQWWRAMGRAFAGALADASVTGGDVAAISVAAQCHGLVPLDQRDEVVRPAKLWNDTTSAPQANELRERIGAARWTRLVGSLPTAAFTLPKLVRYAETEPENFARTTTVLLPHDYLTFRLCGRTVTDRSEASGTGYFDATEGHYLDELLAFADPDRRLRLPEVLGPNEPAGTLAPAAAAELGLNPGTLVAPGAGDQHASALGLGVRPSDFAYSFGTSGVVFTTSVDPVHDERGIVDGVADATGGYLPLVSTLNAARVTDTVAGWLDVDHAVLSRLALDAPGNADRPILVAYLDGERKPNLPGATGLFGGLTTDTTREQLALAAFEGVALGLVGGRDALARVGLTETGRILITGGGARSQAYPQVLADLGGHPVHRPDVAESTARGACVQAAAVLSGGAVSEVRDAWAPTTALAAEPRPDRAAAEVRERYAELARYRGADR